MTFPEVKRAAALAHDGKRVLVVEMEAHPEENLKEALQAATAWAGMDMVVFVENMPVDKRHNAKIDYPALRSRLNRG